MTSKSSFTNQKPAHCLPLTHLWFHFPWNLPFSNINLMYGPAFTLIANVTSFFPYIPFNNLHKEMLMLVNVSLARIWDPCIWPAVCATAWRHYCPAHCVCDPRPAEPPGQRLLGLLHLHLVVLLPAAWRCCSHLLHLCESDSTRSISPTDFSKPFAITEEGIKRVKTLIKNNFKS